MRRTAILLPLLFAAPLFAADEPWRVSVMRVQRGFSASMAYAPRPAWDVEGAVSEQSYDGPTAPPFLGGPPATPHYTLRPVDLFLTHHFLSGSRVSPYVRAGARYVRTPDGTHVTRFFSDGTPPRDEGFKFVTRDSAQLGAGARLRLTPRSALRVEVIRLLRSDASHYDPQTRAAAGLSWHF